MTIKYFCSKCKKYVPIRQVCFSEKIPNTHIKCEGHIILDKGDRKMKDEEMAEEYYYKTYPVTLNIGEEERKKEVTDIFLAGLKAGRPQWHKLSEKYPDADKLVRVRLMSGMEHICETCYYEPTEDEIGYGKLIIYFYELDGEWVDDNEIIAWCEIPTFDKE